MVIGQFLLLLLVAVVVIVVDVGDCVDLSVFMCSFVRVCVF